MTDQLLAELRKMRSTRTNLGLPAGMVALILLTVLLDGLISKPVELASLKDQYVLFSAGTAGMLFAAGVGRVWSAEPMTVGLTRLRPAACRLHTLRLHILAIGTPSAR